MKPCRIFVSSALASLCLIVDDASAQVITEFSDGITAGAQPYDIALGPDGNLWFTEFNGGNQIGRITPLGVVTEFAVGITPGAHPTASRRARTETFGSPNGARTSTST